MFLIKYLEQNRNYAKAGIVPGIILLADQGLAVWGTKNRLTAFRRFVRGKELREERMPRRRCLSFAAH